MDRSIRKCIYVNELNYVIQLNKIADDIRSQLILELFEDSRAEKVYLLKDDIRTVSELKNKVQKIINQQDVVSALLNVFSVNDDLNIPIELREAVFSNVKLAFFVGAGISKLLKIPLWTELARDVISYLKDNNYLNHAESDRLEYEKYTSKQIFSIFHGIVKDKNEIKKFYKKNLKGISNKHENPYELLFQLEDAISKSIIKISTNIDLEWEKILKDKAAKQGAYQNLQGQSSISQLCYERTQFLCFQRNQEIINNVLYQIHGSVHNLDEAVITTAQYVKNYRDDDKLKGFLEKLFKEFIVLFIGSGIQEFEILEHCLKQSPFKHFALLGTRVGEENLFRLKKAYLSEINIKALPYYLDFQGFDRLLYVLQSWTDEIMASKKKRFYDDIKLIDEVL